MIPSCRCFRSSGSTKLVRARRRERSPPQPATPVPAMALTACNQLPQPATWSLVLLALHVRKRHMQQAAPYQTRDPKVVVSPGIALTVRSSTCINHGLNTIHTQARGLSQDGPRATSSILVDMMHVTNHFVITECAMALCILVHAFRFGYKFRKSTVYVISKKLGTFSRSKRQASEHFVIPKFHFLKKLLDHFRHD